MSRVYNFSAGPAVLPEEVLKTAACRHLPHDMAGIHESTSIRISTKKGMLQKILCHIPLHCFLLFDNMQTPIHQ